MKRTFFLLCGVAFVAVLLGCQQAAPPAASTYTVTYSAGGATGSVPADSSAYQTGATVTALGVGGLTNIGYSFGGWNTKSDGTGYTYAGGGQFTLGSADVTLYAVWNHAGYIVTIAGNGTSGYTGDNGPAVSATLKWPGGVAVDASGNVYIAEVNNSVIRKVSKIGQITTVAGTGTAGNSGDGGAATSAMLRNPRGVMVDATGNLYIADTGNNLIRKVDGSGSITTVVGLSASLNGPADVAVDGSGNIFIADTGNGKVKKVTAGVVTILATGLTVPHKIALDASGNLFIADWGGLQILEVPAGGSSASPVAGSTGLANQPYGVAVDASGNLYISNGGSSQLQKLSGGVLTTIAGNGTSGYSGDGAAATLAQMDYPQGVAVDATGNIYVADCYNNRIRKIYP